MEETKKRVFLVVLDSFGVGSMPDREKYGDDYSHTLKSALGENSPQKLANLRELGLFNIDGQEMFGAAVKHPKGGYARLAESGSGKDTTTGHWEIAGVISAVPMPTYPEGFPPEIISELERRTGRRVICNKPYSGTKVIEDYGREHVETGALIVYTSADSVCQIAAHEDIVPTELLYEYCRAAREIFAGEHAVGRIIARPFAGSCPDFYRTTNRHDYSLIPPHNMLDILAENKFATIGVGKIYDIFAGKGVSETYPTTGNTDGINKMFELVQKDFNGLCFVNLVDFDMLYGHRNDPDGYFAALEEFDAALGRFIPKLRNDDLLIITADHGCDPRTASTDHSREYVPMLAYCKEMKHGVNLGTRFTFADISATITHFFKTDNGPEGISFLSELFR